MSILDKIKSLEQPESVEGFLFDVQETTYNYTSYAIAFTAETLNFSPVAIRRSGFTRSKSMETVECKVEIKSTDALAVSLSLKNFKNAASLVIKKYFLNDTAVGYEIFRGVLSDLSFSSGVCTMIFKDDMRHLEKSLCRVRLQSLCNNVLFDSICTLDPDLFVITPNVIVDSTGKELTSNEFTGYPVDYFRLGVCKFNGIYRLITDYNDDTIVISRPFYGLVTNDVVSVWPGCDKTPEKCFNVFDNLDNFVGMPYIPLKDPREVSVTNG